jgi:hypothetical protein
MPSEEGKYKHSTATVDGFGHTTIRGVGELKIEVSGGRDLLHHALIVKAVQDFQDAMIEYGYEIYRAAK